MAIQGTCEVCQGSFDERSLLWIQRISGTDAIMCETCINEYIESLGKLIRDLPTTARKVLDKPKK